KVRMPNGKSKELRGVQLKPAEDGYRKLIGDIFIPELGSLPRADVSVPAGTFRGCFRRDGNLVFSSMSTPSTIWAHPAVPISAIVKAESSDGKSRLELADYGLTGAKSEM